MLTTALRTKILALYPDFSRIYGPYSNPANDGRRFIQLYAPGKQRKRNVSWPRAMMEAKLGRRLLDTEVVDHVDDDPTNDKYGNFQILTYGGNNAKAAIARGAQKQMRSFVCPWCESTFEKNMREVRHNQRSQGKAGPFCSKSCVGKYGAEVQNRGRGAR